MSIISLVNEKGGVAKSTTAVHLAYWLAVQQGKKTVLIDADKQQLSSTWLSKLETEIPFISLAEPDELVEVIPKVADEFDFVIVDGPGKADEETRLILIRSDISIVPVQPTGADLHATGRTLRLISQARSICGDRPIAALFVSRAIKGTRLKEEAWGTLSQIEEAVLLKTMIHQRQAIADTYGQAATVWTLPGKSAKEAIDEYDALFTEIMGLVR
jgi:chromosome partitioning protein